MKKAINAIAKSRAQFLTVLLILEIIILSTDEMERFNALIDPLFAQIRNNSNENVRLATLRDTLLPRLMSGELSVADYDAK